MAAKVLDLESLSPEELARIAGLRYVTDDAPGLRRMANGSGFYYLNSNGRRARDRKVLQRIESLAIPPAWTDVWICPAVRGHLQATGRDARQRKQYIYHEQWQEISNLTKFWRLRLCTRFLPKLRARVARDLSQRRLSRERVLAGMVALLDLTSIRIGNDEYERQNKSYGVATLRSRHVAIQGNHVRLAFRGKSGIKREAIVEERPLVRLLCELKRTRGSRLFKYIAEDGTAHAVDAAAVNEYLRELAPYPFTAKDFRTWKASAIAAGMLYEARALETARKRKRAINKTIKVVAELLGNTSTVCRKYYVHAGLLEQFHAGNFEKIYERFAPRKRARFSTDEQILARFLRCWPAEVPIS